MKILGIASGKGGVGKTTCVLGLALALQELGYKVGIIDLDLESSSLGTSTGLDHSKLVIYDLIQPIDFHGVKAASLSMFPEKEWEDVPTLIDEERKHLLITQLFRSVEWGEVDYMLADLPPGSGEEIRGLLKHPVAGLILVTSKQRLSEMPVRRLVRMAREQYKIPILGIIENDCYNQDGDTGERLAKSYKLPLLAKIPNNPAIGKAMDNGELLPTNYFIEAAKTIVKEKKDERHKRTHDPRHRTGQRPCEPTGSDEGQTNRPSSAAKGMPTPPGGGSSVSKLAKTPRRQKADRPRSS